MADENYSCLLILSIDEWLKLGFSSPGIVLKQAEGPKNVIQDTVTYLFQKPFVRQNISEPLPV